MSAPTVSVVIPAYNAAWCAGRAVDSVLAQTFRDFELIVVDDGSTDNTVDVLAGYGERIRTLSKPNGGLSSARNAGIQAARGEFVAFLDADDWWMPEKLVRQVAWMQAHPETIFCSTAARLVNPEGESIGEWRCGACSSSALEAIFSANAHVAGSGSAVVARRQALLETGGFDERLGSLEDIDMWMRLAARGGYQCIDEPLAVVVKRPDSMSRHLDVMRAAAMLVMRKNRHLLPENKRGAFWRHAYAGMLSDYAKWAYRSDRRSQALRDLLAGICLAPVSRGRLLLGLLAAMLRNQPV
jgi:glycosyltransferase involved in cell wall biosynthesis